MNKYLIPLALILLFTSCNMASKTPEISIHDYVVNYDEPIPTTKNDFVSISGKISNNSTDSLIIKTYPNKTYSKTIAIAKDGSFKDTLHIKAARVYKLDYGKKGTAIFLKNGFDLNLNFDAINFEKTLSYTGYGAMDNTFMNQRNSLQNKLMSTNISPENLEKKLVEIKNKMNTFYDLHAKKVDTFIINPGKKGLDNAVAKLKRNFNHNIAIMNVLPKGMKSPAFKNYENYDGSTTSLSDFKGKFVYIDVWATWCVPCIAEIPDLEILEKKYHGNKNIVFISMTVDKQKDHQKWKDFVKNENLGGIQLMVPKDFDSQFIKDYIISSIPRFILIDPEGKIVSPNAMRPSNPEIIEYFNELGI